MQGGLASRAGEKNGIRRKFRRVMVPWVKDINGVKK